MSDPPGTKKCHFLDITADTVGPHGINDKNRDHLTFQVLVWLYYWWISLSWPGEKSA